MCIRDSKRKHKSKKVTPPNNTVMESYDKAISYVATHNNSYNLSSTNVPHLVSLCYQYARNELSDSAFESEVAKNLDNK